MADGDSPRGVSVRDTFLGECWAEVMGKQTCCSSNHPVASCRYPRSRPILQLSPSIPASPQDMRIELECAHEQHYLLQTYPPSSPFLHTRNQHGVAVARDLTDSAPHATENHWCTRSVCGLRWFWRLCLDRSMPRARSRIRFLGQTASPQLRSVDAVSETAQEVSWEHLLGNLRQPSTHRLWIGDTVPSDGIVTRPDQDRHHPRGGGRRRRRTRRYGRRRPRPGAVPTNGGLRHELVERQTLVERGRPKFLDVDAPAAPPGLHRTRRRRRSTSRHYGGLVLGVPRGSAAAKPYPLSSIQTPGSAAIPRSAHRACRRS